MNTNHNWQSAYVQTAGPDGIRIHYTRTGGSLPPLVLLHGFTDNGLCWSPVAQVLQTDYDIIMPDSRGHGKSDAPESGYDPVRMAGDVADMVEGLGLQKPLVLGHSMGAITAIALASTYPDVPRAILLEDPPDFWVKRPPTTHMETNFQAMKSTTRDHLLANQRTVTPGWSDAELEPWADSKMEVHANALNVLKPAMRELDWHGMLARITCPALIITADTALGAISGPESVAKFRASVPQLEEANIANAGHSIRRDQFALYMDVVRSFLSRHAG